MTAKEARLLIQEIYRMSIGSDRDAYDLWQIAESLDGEKDNIEVHPKTAFRLEKIRKNCTPFGVNNAP